MEIIGGHKQELFIVPFTLQSAKCRSEMKTHKFRGAFDKPKKSSMIIQSTL